MKYNYNFSGFGAMNQDPWVPFWYPRAARSSIVLLAAGYSLMIRQGPFRLLLVQGIHQVGSH